MKLRVESIERTGRLNLWVLARDGSWRCGNVRVKREWDKRWGWWHWFVWMRRGNEWVRVCCPSRPWGYGSAGQAKNGVGRMVSQRSRLAVLRKVRQ